MPAPSGSVTVAVLRYELAIGSDGSNGIPTSMVTGSGESVRLSTLTSSDGSNGTLSQPSPANGVVKLFVT